MVEFFQNIGNWFVTNKDEIVLFFTSSNFVAFITAIVMLIKHLKSNKINNDTNKALKTSLDATIAVANDVINMREDSAAINEKISKLKEEVESVQKQTSDALDVLTQKLNAVLEVQSLVYSTIKDDTIRKNVTGILADAKYAETTTRAALEAEIDSLKKKVNEKIEVIKGVVEDTATKVKKVAKNNKSSVPRY